MQAHPSRSSLPRWLLVLCLLTVVTLAVTPGRRAPEPETPQVLRLQWGTFDPTRGDVAPPSGELGLADPTASRYQIVQFNGPVEESWKAGLAAAGLEPLIYVPDNAFIVRVADGTDLATAAVGAAVREPGTSSRRFSAAAEASRLPACISVRASVESRAGLAGSIASALVR